MNLTQRDRPPGVVADRRQAESIYSRNGYCSSLSSDNALAVTVCHAVVPTSFQDPSTRVIRKSVWTTYSRPVTRYRTASNSVVVSGSRRIRSTARPSMATTDTD